MLATVKSACVVGGFLVGCFFPLPSGAQPKPTPLPPPVQTPAAPWAGAAGDVFDFCAPTPATAKFVRQRVVVFAPAGAEKLDEDPKLASAQAGYLLRQVFLSRFPSTRFRNVAGGVVAKTDWVNADAIPLASLVDHVKKTPPASDGETTDPIAYERSFLSYSLACADFVVIPSLASVRVLWSEVMSKIEGGEKRLKAPLVDLDARLGLFKRSGALFLRIATVRARVPSSADVERDDAALLVPALPPSDDSPVPAVDLPSHQSAFPNPNCAISAAPRDGTAGLTSCGPRGYADTELAPTGSDEWQSPTCRSGRTGKGDDPETSWIRCFLRVRSAQLARSLQKATQQVDGWKLFGVLLRGTESNPSAYSMALGRDEGIRTGDGFTVRDASGDRIAYLKAVDIGAGGTEGDTDRTSLRLRAGDAEVGSKLERWSQVGLSLAPSMGFSSFLANDGESTVGRSVYAPPSTLFGVGASLGVDLSGVLGWSETALRIGAGYYAGGGTNARGSFIPLELLFEKGFPVGPRLSLFVAVGGHLTLASVTLLANGVDMLEDRSFGSLLFGPAARFGLDLLLHPDVSLRLEASTRVPVQGASYGASDGGSVPLTWSQRSDRYVSVGSNLGVVWVY